MLVQVASHGENSGFEVPCLIVSAKDDLDPYPLAIQESTRVCCRLSFGLSYFGISIVCTMIKMSILIYYVVGICLAWPVLCRMVVIVQCCSKKH